MARRDTTLESEGAEYLVLAQLLIRGIEAYKAPAGMKGHDITATHGKRAVRIQVKSRIDGSRGVYARNFDADFFVFVMLNRHTGADPRVFIYPMRLVEKHIDTASGSKFLMRRIPNSDSYENLWDLIISKLKVGS